MATITKAQTAYATLSTTTADIVKLTSAWDELLVSNLHASEIITVTQDGGTATAAEDGGLVVPPATTLRIRANKMGNGIIGNETTPPHLLSVIGNGNVYAIQGVKGLI